MIRIVTIAIWHVRRDSWNDSFVKFEGEKNFLKKNILLVSFTTWCHSLSTRSTIDALVLLFSKSDGHHAFGHVSVLLPVGSVWLPQSTASAQALIFSNGHTNFLHFEANLRKGKTGYSVCTIIVKNISNSYCESIGWWDRFFKIYICHQWHATIMIAVLQPLKFRQQYNVSTYQSGRSENKPEKSSIYMRT